MRRSANHIASEQAAARGWLDFPPNAISIAQYDGDQLVLLPDRDDLAVWHQNGELLPVEIDWT